MARRGAVWEGAVVAELGGGPWALTLDTPADGPYLLLTDLVVGDDAVMAGASGPVGARLIGVGRSLEVPPVYAEPPPALIDVEGRLRDPAGVAATFEAPELDVISDSAVYRATHFKDGSPVQVTEDGAPLPIKGVCLEVRTEGAGRFCHRGPKIHFSATDDSDPAARPDAYGLRLDPDRRRGRGWWLYPGDRAVFTPRVKVLRRFPAGADVLEIAAAVLGEPVGVVAVVAMVDDDIALATEVPLTALAEGPVQLPLPMGSPSSLSLTLALPEGAGWVLLTNVAIQRAPL